MTPRHLVIMMAAMLCGAASCARPTDRPTVPDEALRTVDPFVTQAGQADHVLNPFAAPLPARQTKRPPQVSEQGIVDPFAPRTQRPTQRRQRVSEHGVIDPFGRPALHR